MFAITTITTTTTTTTVAAAPAANDIASFSPKNGKIISAEPVTKVTPSFQKKNQKKLLVFFLISLCSIIATICAASLVVSGTIIPHRPDFVFNLQIKLTQEEMQQIECGESTLELSLGNKSLSVVVPPEHVQLSGDLGIVSGRMSPQTW